MGSVPLEFVVDMGFEKLIRDYLYILRGARFVDLRDIRQKLDDISSGIFNTENYRWYEYGKHSVNWIDQAQLINCDFINYLQE